jgi:Ricin-type beta-trefoil lectin domain
MSTKHSGSETFLFAILLFVCLILALVYYFWYGVTANSAATQQTLIAVSSMTPTLDPVPATVKAALATATSQTATAAAKQPTKTFTPTNPPRPLKAQLMEIIAIEVDASKRADVEQAMSLFAPNAVITDDASKTQWVGLAQIRSRYIETFKRYQFLENVDEFIDLKQDSEISATVRVTQTGKDLDLSSGKPFDTPQNLESWQFVKLQGEWKIASLTYFLPLSASKYYTIQNFHNQLCLEQYTNLAVVQDDCHGAPPSQWWQFLPTDDKNFQNIINKSGKCVDIDGNGGVMNGIIARNCDPSRDTQFWKLELHGGYFTIIGKHPDPTKPGLVMCVDVRQFSHTPGLQMLYFDCNQDHNGVNDANQLWLATVIQ